MNNETIFDLWVHIRQKIFIVLVEDTDRTERVDACMYQTEALNEDEAIGKMWKEKPHFRNRKIINISKY